MPRRPAAYRAAYRGDRPGTLKTDERAELSRLRREYR